MSEKKPTPILVEKQSKKCPICNKPSYSRDGIHPQCAMAKSDTTRKVLAAAAALAAAALLEVVPDADVCLVEAVADN